MEVRDFTGCFVLDGRETEIMELRVILSTGGGVTSGSGSFALPMALVGRAEQAPLTFRLAGKDETLTLLVREVDLVDGVAYFLTEGDVPEVGHGAAQAARRA